LLASGSKVLRDRCTDERFELEADALGPTASIGGFNVSRYGRLQPALGTMRLMSSCASLLPSAAGMTGNTFDDFRPFDGHILVLTVVRRGARRHPGPPPDDATTVGLADRQWIATPAIAGVEPAFVIDAPATVRRRAARKVRRAPAAAGSPAHDDAGCRQSCLPRATLRPGRPSAARPQLAPSPKLDDKHPSLHMSLTSVTAWG
jgi:hypothetical protein